MLAQLARHIQNRRRAQAEGEDIVVEEGEGDDDELRVALPEDCHVQ